MILILETSAAIEVVLNRKTSKKYREFLLDADWVIAPDVFISEVANVFWKYFQFGDIPLQQCEDHLENSLGMVDEVIKSKDLYREAFALSCQVRHPIYDTLFLALARRYNGSLLTLDQKVLKIAAKHSIKTLS